MQERTVSDTSTFNKNAIWIFGDQHPAHALSCNGDPNLNTPHSDSVDRPWRGVATVDG